MLNEEDHSFLVEFLNARMNSLFDINLPKILIISSLDYRTFCFKYLQKFNDIKIKISREIIEHLYELSYPDQPSDYCYQENKKSKKQLEELNKKNEEFEIIKNQNAKIKQENETIIKENTKQKKEINILEKKAKELNSQLANKTKEFNIQLRTKAEKLKKLQNQLDELLKQTNGETIKVLDSNTINNLEIIEEI